VEIRVTVGWLMVVGDHGDEVAAILVANDHVELSGAEVGKEHYVELTRGDPRDRFGVEPAFSKTTSWSILARASAVEATAPLVSPSASMWDASSTRSAARSRPAQAFARAVSSGTGGSATAITTRWLAIGDKLTLRPVGGKRLRVSPSPLRHRRRHHLP